MKEKKEKVKQAIALSYDPAEEAPKVIASGKGVLAERMREHRSPRYRYTGMTLWQKRCQDWKSEK